MRSQPCPIGYLICLITALVSSSVLADVRVPTLFSDHMVLQRDKPILIWGWAEAGEEVTVSLLEESSTVTTGESGKWQVTLPAMPAGGPYSITISGNNEVLLEDVYLGEVWIASGQSNMQWALNGSINEDISRLMVNRAPVIRFNQVWNEGSQTPVDWTSNPWMVADAGNIKKFSAVAYAFAETLHATLGVPVGIIQNAWGGSNAEAWVDRQVIINDPKLSGIHEEWLEIEATYDFGAELAAYQKKMEAWEEAAAKAKMEDRHPPKKPRKPQNRMTTQHRPGNLWNGRLLPVAPIPMRGVIWYQGEGNAHTVERANQYEHLFSTLITEWRKLWGEDFPFYWVQLADFKKESGFSEDDTWAYLRNSQTKTMALPNTGQAVIIDLGEGKDIHPRHKEEVGRRLARWALAKDYGYSDLAHRSPELKSWEQNGENVVLNFNYTGKGLRAFDSNVVTGFAVKSEDESWIEVKGTVQGKNRVILDVDPAIKVTAVGYAWAYNPVCNLFSIEGLPATPFRTDLE